MTAFFIVISLVVALVILHMIYWGWIVPFHMKYAAKRGLKYCPQRNKYFDAEERN